MWYHMWYHSDPRFQMLYLLVLVRTSSYQLVPICSFSFRCTGFQMHVMGVWIVMPKPDYFQTAPFSCKTAQRYFMYIHIIYSVYIMYIHDIYQSDESWKSATLQGRNGCWNNFKWRTYDGITGEQLNSTHKTCFTERRDMQCIYSVYTMYITMMIKSSQAKVTREPS